MKLFPEIYARDLNSRSLKDEMDAQGYLLIRGLLPLADLNQLLSEITQIVHAAGWLLPDFDPVDRRADMLRPVAIPILCLRVPMNRFSTWNHFMPSRTILFCSRL